MAFSVPAFPLTVNIWDNVADYTTDPPRVVTVGNLSYGRRSMTQYWNWAASVKPPVLAVLLLPPFTDVRDQFDAGGQDWVEVPAGSGRFYSVQLADDVAKGFPNEYRIAFIAKDSTYALWPTPMP